MGLFSKGRKNGSGCRLVSNRFMLTFPQGWVDRSIYRFDGPEADGIQHHITVNIEQDVAVSDLEKYAQRQIKALETELFGYLELKRGRLTLDNQMSAYELVYKWQPVKGREAYQRMVWVLQDDTGYALTATFSKKTWKMMADEIDHVIKSFTALVPTC
ncbi:MAG: DcrB-related protein [Desulfatitalea sp.]|nr:DUF1795 domain-containing protein [Desulfatitalea sp.]NNK00042.1 DcrB-related protein [Desulfatitalea sp.]